jgi:two-component system LytT family response regulator
MSTCVILEDDPSFLVILKNYLKRIPDIEVIGTYSSTIEAARQITKLKPDLLFLDVEIDGLSGLDVWEVLEKKPRTIVMSSNPEYVHEALALDVVDFLVKPIHDINRVQLAVRKALK